MASTHPDSRTTQEQGSQPTGDDHLELRAAEIAKRNGRSLANDEDRKVAYEEMKERGQPAPNDEPAPH
jgi:hypothetical protein